MTTMLRVGELFASGVTTWPEASHYAWDPAHGPAAYHRLVVFAARPTARELVAFRSGGRLELALLAEGPAVVLLWSGAGWPWSDAPYSWHLQAAKRPAGAGPLGVPDMTAVPPGAGVPLDAILVDAASGWVAAIRRVAMPGDFAVGLHRAIAAQAAAPWDERAYDATLGRLSGESCEALIARASSRCQVGGGR